MLTHMGNPTNLFICDASHVCQFIRLANTTHLSFSRSNGVDRTAERMPSSSTTTTTRCTTTFSDDGSKSGTGGGREGRQRVVRVVGAEERA